TEVRKISDLFSAPAVSVNAFNRLYHNSELYFALFQPAENIHWPGNVKRFQVGPYDSDGDGKNDQYAILDAGGKLAVDPKTGFFSEKATSFWTPTEEAPDGGEPELGGAASKQPDDPDTRKVFTYTGDYSPDAVKDLSHPENRLHESNSSITEAMLGLPAPDPLATVPEKTLLLQWARGMDVDDEDEDAVTAEARKEMGDPLHASPVLVSYKHSGTTEDITLFVTSNDGYLHAIDTDKGTELFSFVPKEMLARLKTLRDNLPLSASGRNYGLDGPMTVWIKENASDTDSNIEPGEGDHVYLYFGERRGGRNYYALDVTDRDAPELLWKIEGGVIGGDFEELGETWSAPKHTKVKIGSTETDVLIFGGGYDPNQESATVPVDDGQGRAIYMVNAKTGERLWWTGNKELSPDLGFAEMTNSIPANVRVMDLDRDGLADRMYAADLRGQLWRFDINNGSDAGGPHVSGALMAQLQKPPAASTPTEADNRRFFNEPDAALI
ncbi:MAG: pilus assembly protein, partial [Gammaproteobacteria bacterium]